MTPAHHSHERRWRVVALVVLVVAGVAVAVGVRGTPAPVGAAATPERAGRRAKCGVVRLVLHRAVHRVGRVAGLPRAHQHDAQTRHRDHHRHDRLGCHRAHRRGRAASRRGGPAHPRPVVGLLGVRDRDHLGRRRGCHPDGAQLAGLVTGALPERDLAPVVLRRRLHLRGKRALHLAAQSHVDAGRGGPELPDALRHGPPDQLPGDRARGGPGDGGERDVRGATGRHSQHGRRHPDRPRRRIRGAGAGGAGWGIRRALARAGRDGARAALGDPAGAGGAGRLLRNRRLQPGHGNRDGDGAVPIAFRPVDAAHRQSPARDDLESPHERADPDSRQPDLRHLRRRHGRTRRRRGKNRQPAQFRHAATAVRRGGGGGRAERASRPAASGSCRHPARATVPR